MHVAELSPIEGTNMCAMKRLIEMLDGRNITGIWSNNGTSIGMINTPNRHVPHPDSYSAFPDISVCTLNALQFEGLWMETTKPRPIRSIDRTWQNAFGVLADDLMAAAYTLLPMAVWSRLFG